MTGLTGYGTGWFRRFGVPRLRGPLFILSFLFILSSLSSFGGVVTDTLKKSDGTVRKTSLLFHPTSTPLLNPGDVSTTTDVSTNSDTNGIFTVTLRPGNYRVTIGGLDSINISCPSGDWTNNLATLAGTNTYQFANPTTFETLAHKGTNSGYASLDTNAFIPLAQLGNVPSYTNNLATTNYVNAATNAYNPTSTNIANFLINAATNAYNQIVTNIVNAISPVPTNLSNLTVTNTAKFMGSVVATNIADFGTINARTNLAIGGATIGANALALKGSALFSSAANTAGLTYSSDASGNYIIGSSGGGRTDIGSTDGQVNMRVGGVNAYGFTGTAFLSVAGANTYDLGSSAVPFKSGYFQTSLVLGSSSAVTLVPGAANTLAQRNGTVEQTNRVYGSFTDTSNGYWLESGYDAINAAFFLRSLGNGTGVGNRPLNLGAFGTNTALSIATNGTVAMLNITPPAGFSDITNLGNLTLPTTALLRFGSSSAVQNYAGDMYYDVGGNHYIRVNSDIKFAIRSTDGSGKFYYGLTIAGQTTLSNTTNTTATAGTATLPAQPSGFMSITNNGKLIKIPYYEN